MGEIMNSPKDVLERVSIFCPTSGYGDKLNGSSIVKVVKCDKCLTDLFVFSVLIPRHYVGYIGDGT